MKTLIVLSLLILSANCVIFQCTYSSKAWAQVGTLYGCTVSTITVTTLATIEDVRGTLAVGKTLADVEAFSVTKKTMVKIPENLEDFFPSLKAIQIYDMKLESITIEDLKPFPKLEFINVAANLLTTISGDLFSFNPNLKVIYIYNNKVTSVGQFILDGMEFLADVQFGGNVCTVPDNPSDTFKATNADELEQLKDDLLRKCLPVGETIAPKTTTAVTTTTTTTTIPTTTTTPTTTTSTTTTPAPECQHRCTLNNEVDELKKKLENLMTNAGKIQTDVKNLEQNFLKLQAETKSNANRISELEKRDCNKCNTGIATKSDIWGIFSKGAMLLIFVKFLDQVY